ncbi:MAG: hypothetical protein WAN74_06430 [Thermoplasmata archaeon]
MPRIISDRHAIVALVVGFLLEAVTEVYQILTTVGSVRSNPLGYYLSLVMTLVGFYFLWRGLHEWNRLHPRPVRPGPRRVPWPAISMLGGGILATGVLNIGLGTVGSGDTPAVVAWIVGGVMVLAIGAFFLRLRTMVDPLQGPTGRVLGWTAFAWSLGVSTISGLALGQVIVGLFIDFFTNWPAMFLALAPFIFAIAPLFVTYGLLSIGYVEAYRNASPGEGPTRPGSSPPEVSPRSTGSGASPAAGGR